jgi:Spy/CpxP family protein refolding chaperone
MKYKHAFLLSLPFTVLGLGKAIHKFRSHHGGSCCGDHKHKHFLKILSWRLGLSAEQQSNMYTLMKQTRSSMEEFKSKKSQIHEKLMKSFSQETFDTTELLNSVDSKDFDRAKSVLATAMSEFHKILTPLQREKVQEHLMRRHHCHHWC